MHKSLNAKYFLLKSISVTAAVATLWATPGYAQTSSSTLKTGEQVYQSTCMQCHAQAVDNAPKFGDKKVWAPLIEEGQAILTSHAWVGVRKMPPKGGNPGLTQEEFARAVAYMARAAGGSWQDPDKAMLIKIREEEAARLKEIKQGK